MKIKKEKFLKMIKESITNVLSDDITIYCDMDGVIADFNAGIINKMNDYLDFYAKGGQIPSNSLQKGLDRILKSFGINYRISQGEDIDSIKLLKRLKYSVIVQDPGDFFYNLPPLIDGVNGLWPFIMSLNIPVKVLSAPIRSTKGMSAEQGKIMWVQENLSPQPIDIIIVDAIQKQNYATTLSGKPNILIDDKEETIEQWNAAGGIGILHPTGNSQYSIQALRNILSI